MSLAIEINKRLDEMLAIRAEIKRMNEDLDEDVQLKNLETGKPTTKKQALKVVEDMITEIKNDFNGENYSTDEDSILSCPNLASPEQLSQNPNKYYKMK